MVVDLIKRMAAVGQKQRGRELLLLAECSPSAPTVFDICSVIAN